MTLSSRLLHDIERGCYVSVEYDVGLSDFWNLTSRQWETLSFVSLGHIPHCTGMRAGRPAGCGLLWGWLGQSSDGSPAFYRDFACCRVPWHVNRVQALISAVSIKVAISTNKCSFTLNMSLM